MHLSYRQCRTVSLKMVRHHGESCGLSCVIQGRVKVFHYFWKQVLSGRCKSLRPVQLLQYWPPFQFLLFNLPAQQVRPVRSSRTGRLSWDVNTIWRPSILFRHERPSHNHFNSTSTILETTLCLFNFFFLRASSRQCCAFCLVSSCWTSMCRSINDWYCISARIPKPIKGSSCLSRRLALQYRIFIQFQPWCMFDKVGPSRILEEPVLQFILERLPGLSFMFIERVISFLRDCFLVQSQLPWIRILTHGRQYRNFFKRVQSLHLQFNYLHVGFVFYCRFPWKCICFFEPFFA